MKIHQIALDLEAETNPASMPITLNDFNVPLRVGSEAEAAHSGFGLSGPVQDSSQMEVSTISEAFFLLFSLNFNSIECKSCELISDVEFVSYES
ncbi:hypothetical protein SASPL_153618 [Salvia splendens]|uniref:Uncharacterized protein n=1 Tax=Salvia splendens TaxID=180675 RepID=A0A8X8VYN2_SALSN|nr:hypothetical protein SASPL_153618 [Salvia splendens]